MGKDLNGKNLGNGISQRKDGIYSARFVDRFGKRVSLYNKNLRELKNAVQKAIYEDKAKINTVNQKITLDEWYDKWIEIHKYNVIRANTKLRYKQIFSKHISPTIGRCKLESITQLQIKELLKDLDKNGYKFETKNKVRVLLLDMFNKAMIDNFVSKNPAKGIKLKRDEDKDINVLTQDEQTEFFDCCKGTFYDNLFIVAVSTGLRPGELYSLREKDVDFDKKEISVTRTLLYQKLEGDTKKTFHFEAPKTKTSIRKVPINRQCEIALKKQIFQKNVIMSKTPKIVDDEFGDLLFTTKFGTPLNAQIYSDAIKVIVNQINLCKDDLEQMEYFSGHCFRHCFATRCFEAGIQPKTVQSYLGHATLQMTMDLYTSVLQTFKQEEMNKLETALDDVFTSGDRMAENKYNEMVQNQKKETENVVQFNGVKMA